jgi:hypothetical protein
VLWHILGWATFVAIMLTTVGTIRLIWLSLARPWAFRPHIRAPREVKGLDWEAVIPDQTIPWS